MEFTIELYETEDGKPVVREELEDIRRQTAVLFDLLATGLEKLTNSQFHHLPLCRPLGNDLSRSEGV